jgi:hypothetical protein
MYSFPEKASKFNKLKGLFLASSGIAGSILGEPPKIFVFQT